MGDMDQLRDGQISANLKNEGNPFREKEEINISDYLRIFSRRRWSIIAIWLAVGAIAIIYNFSATKYYSSRASIIIKTSSPVSVLRTKETAYPNYLSTRVDFETKTKMITSRPILAKAAEKLVAVGYYRPDNFEKMSEENKQETYKSVGSKLGGKVSYAEVEQTNMVQITAVDTDPRRAAATANALAEAMVNYNALEQEMWALSSLKFLNQQLEEARQRLGQAEAKLFEYKEKLRLIKPTWPPGGLGCRTNCRRSISISGPKRRGCRRSSPSWPARITANILPQLLAGGERVRSAWIAAA